VPFDDRRYTEDSLIKQLTLIELHAKDGSALDAGCGCIEGKHLFAVEGLAEEGVGFALSEKEKVFYEKLGSAARECRKAIEDSSFEFPHNPFHPTEREATHPHLLRKTKSCITQAEISCCGKPTSDYSKCSCNPVAVCRASLGT